MVSELALDVTVPVPVTFKVPVFFTTLYALEDVLLIVPVWFKVNVPLFVIKSTFDEVVNVPAPVIVNVPALVNVTPFNIVVFPFKSIVTFVFPEAKLGAVVSVIPFKALIV